MQWSHLHGEDEDMIWTVPAELSKTDEKIRRPVPLVVRETLEKMGFYMVCQVLYSQRILFLGGFQLQAKLLAGSSKEQPKGLVSEYFRPHDTRRTLVTTVRKNMKAKVMSAFDRAMLSKRYIIETINDQLKNIL